jgi:hypothetical protein
MLRTLLSISIFLFFGQVHAEWHIVGRPSADVARYIDLTTIKGSGGVRRVWMLTDFDGPNPSSMIGLGEFECREDKIRFLSGRIYSGRMGNGKSAEITDGLPTHWKYVQPGTLEAQFQRLVCR